MRPAPPADPLAVDATAEGFELPPDPQSEMDAPPPARYDRPRLATAARIAVVVIGLALLGASVALVVARNPRLIHRRHTPLTATSPPPSAAAFTFTSVHIRALAAARGVSTTASTSVAEDVRSSLTSFYQATFSDPSAWARGAPDSAWDVFAQTVRDRAKAQATSLALASQAPSLRSLRVTSATLDLTVLIDSGGHAQAAVAAVSIVASGAVDTGASVDISAEASFVLRRTEKRWLVTGWPKATLSIQPAPAPSVDPSVGPSAGPSGGATPSLTPSVGSSNGPTPTPQVSP